MRILIVCSDFGIPVYGHKGASVHLRAMTRALADIGHEVCIVSPRGEVTGNPDFTFPVRSLPFVQEDAALLEPLRQLDRHLGDWVTGHPPRLTQEIRNLLYNRSLAGAVEELQERRPDIVYERYALFGFGGIELARAMGIPHLLEVNAPLVREHERARGIHLKSLARTLETRIWTSTDALLVVSEALRDEAVEAGVVPDRTHVVPNGVDPSLFTVGPDAGVRTRTALGLGAGPVIGFVGSLKPWHGTEFLLQVFAGLHERHPDAKLLVVGDGPQREALEAEIEAAGLRAAVYMTGAVDHARIPEIMAAMSLATAPYLPQEDFYFSPIKIYEAMVLGLPVVASRIGQIRDLVDAGLVVGAAPGDLHAWSSALEALLRDSGSSARMAAQSRAWARRERTWSANARRVASLAESLRAH